MDTPVMWETSDTTLVAGEEASSYGPLATVPPGALLHGMGARSGRRRGPGGAAVTVGTGAEDDVLPASATPLSLLPPAGPASSPSSESLSLSSSLSELPESSSSSDSSSSEDDRELERGGISRMLTRLLSLKVTRFLGLLPLKRMPCGRGLVMVTAALSASAAAASGRLAWLSGAMLLWTLPLM